MATIKDPGTNPEDAPDVRPIGIGEGGLGLLVFGVELLLELHPDWVAVKLDMRKACNEPKCAASNRSENTCSKNKAYCPCWSCKQRRINDASGQIGYYILHRVPWWPGRQCVSSDRYLQCLKATEPTFFQHRSTLGYSVCSLAM